MRFVYDDGGRTAAGYLGTTRDCVTRAIAVATGLPYQTVYDGLIARANHLPNNSGFNRALGAISHPRTGVPRKIYEGLLTDLGWTWTPTMQIGSGCTVHLRDGELPMGRLIVRCSHHLVAVIDGVIHDTRDPSRGGSRCVYGFYFKRHLP